jgi:hypothetical protein
MEALKGTATVADPIRRGEHGCAVRGCLDSGGMLRLTEAGYFVRYCAYHERAAAQAFDKTDDDA